MTSNMLLLHSHNSMGGAAFNLQKYVINNTLLKQLHLARSTGQENRGNSREIYRGFFLIVDADENLSPFVRLCHLNGVTVQTTHEQTSSS